jgi:hypothetical protein
VRPWISRARAQGEDHDLKQEAGPVDCVLGRHRSCAGFADSTFAPAKAGADIEGFAKTGDFYTYEKHGFEALSGCGESSTCFPPTARGHLALFHE